MAASQPQTAILTISGPLRRADLPGLCERFCALLSTVDVEVVLLDVAGVGADAVAADALARLALAARRRGRRMRVRRASSELRALIVFMGLGEALGLGGDPA